MKRTKKHSGNRHPHPPTPAARAGMQGLIPARPRTQDPWAITQPVDETYRHRHADDAWIERSSDDRYGTLVARHAREA